MWQDGRTADLCQQWKAQGLGPIGGTHGAALESLFQRQQGQWLLNHDAAAAAAAEHGDLCFGTVESWLLWKLTAGRHHCSDMSNASRTLLMDLEKRQWVDRFCEQSVCRTPLCELVPCCGDFG